MEAPGLAAPRWPERRDSPVGSIDFSATRWFALAVASATRASSLRLSIALVEICVRVAAAAGFLSRVEVLTADSGVTELNLWPDSVLKNSLNKEVSDGGYKLGFGRHHMGLSRGGGYHWAGNVECVCSEAK